MAGRFQQLIADAWQMIFYLDQQVLLIVLLLTALFQKRQVGIQFCRHQIWLQHKVDMIGLNCMSRYFMILGRFRILHHRHSASFLDRIQTVGTITTHSREHNTDCIRANNLGQGTKGGIDHRSSLSLLRHSTCG